MAALEQLSQDYDRIEKTIQFLENNFHRQPSLDEIATHANLSEFHFQRLFSRWVGISPKRFLQYLTKEYAKRLLRDSQSVLTTAYDAGLSGPSRLHDLMVACEAVSPGEYKTGGDGIRIAFGFHPSPFGECLLAVTKRGLCGLSFVQSGNAEDLVHGLTQKWPKATITFEPDQTEPLADRIFNLDANRPQAPLHLYVRGTNFQIKVWEALLNIPLGRAVSYSDLARYLDMPGAARAVGNAVGRNPIPFLIPCHRVLRKIGEFGNYGEGPARKKAILAWEAVQLQSGRNMDITKEKH